MRKFFAGVIAGLTILQNIIKRLSTDIAGPVGVGEFAALCKGIDRIAKW
jgi:hypothetical protein